MIYKAYLIYDKKNNISRGFGFVEFMNNDASIAVLSIPEHTIKGKVIECKTIMQKSELD